MLFGDRDQSFEHVRMRAATLYFSDGIVIQVVKFRRFVLLAFRPETVAALGDEMGLPRADANGVQLLFPPVEDTVSRTLCRSCPAAAARDRSRPSVRSVGSRRRPEWQNVGSRSIVAPISICTPGLTFPGHQKNVGSRMPPSKVVPLPSRSRPAEPPCVWNGSQGPLSEVNTTSVSSSRSSSVKRRQDLAHAGVDLLDHVAEEAAAAACPHVPCRRYSGMCGRLWAR